MRYFTPWILLVLSLVTGAFVLFGDDSLGRLAGLREAIDIQKNRNDELDSTVMGLKREVRALQGDDRALEKVARNELGMARPGEYIFIFEDDPSAGAARPSVPVKGAKKGEAADE